LFAKLVAHNKLDREQSKAFLAKDAALFKAWDEYRAEKEAGLNPLPYDLLKKIQRIVKFPTTAPDTRDDEGELTDEDEEDLEHDSEDDDEDDDELDEEDDD